MEKKKIKKIENMNLGDSRWLLNKEGVKDAWVKYLRSTDDKETPAPIPN